jgi:SAM-dependent methyltransferase
MHGRGEGPIQRYERRLLAPTPAGALHRFLIGPVGTFLTNTPVFLLPPRLNLQPKHRVLDLQAGRGGILCFLAARIPFHERPVGLDASPAVLRLARRDMGAAPPVDLVAGRLTHLPFADGSFDLVIAAHAFRHLADPGLRQCLVEVHRVLRASGVLVAWEFAPLSSRALNRFHLWLLARDPVRPHLRGFGPLAHLAAEAGFVRIERPLLRPFLFPPIPRTAIFAQKGEE